MDANELPVGACFECLTSSWVRKEPDMAFGKCMGCGKVTDCIRADSIQLFVPYIPMQTLDLQPDGTFKRGELGDSKS